MKKSLAIAAVVLITVISLPCLAEAVQVPPEDGCGDVYSDGYIDNIDVVFYIDWLYKGGSPPFNWAGADVNYDGERNILDIIVLIDYIYKEGPEPYCGPW